MKKTAETTKMPLGFRRHGWNAECNSPVTHSFVSYQVICQVGLNLELFSADIFLQLQNIMRIIPIFLAMTHYSCSSYESCLMACWASQMTRRLPHSACKRAACFSTGLSKLRGRSGGKIAMNKGGSIKLQRFLRDPYSQTTEILPSRQARKTLQSHHVQGIISSNKCPHIDIMRQRAQCKDPKKDSQP